LVCGGDTLKSVGLDPTVVYFALGAHKKREIRSLDIWKCWN